MLRAVLRSGRVALSRESKVVAFQQEMTASESLSRCLSPAGAFVNGVCEPVQEPVRKPQGVSAAAFHTISSALTGGVAQQSSASNTVYDVGSSTNIKWHEAKVSKDDRQRLLGQRGCVIWMTGLSGSGKSTLAYTLEHALMEAGKIAVVLDGDNVRHGLNKNLGFSAADREENIRRVGEVAKLFADAGIVTIVSFISPYKKDRDAARALMSDGTFIEVYMKIPLAVCEQRDPKGLYKKARAGLLKGFTGIDDPYEEPDAAEIVMEVAKEDGVLKAPEVMTQDIVKFLADQGYLSSS